MQDDIKENHPDLNENDPINNNSIMTQAKDNKKTILNRNTRTKPPATVILGDSTLKNACGNSISKAAKFKKHFRVKHFPGATVDDNKTLYETYSRKITRSNSFSHWDKRSGYQKRRQ